MTIIPENKKVINNLCYVIIVMSAILIIEWEGVIWETYRLTNSYIRIMLIIYDKVIINIQDREVKGIKIDESWAIKVIIDCFYYICT